MARTLSITLLTALVILSGLFQFQAAPVIAKAQQTLAAKHHSHCCPLFLSRSSGGRDFCRLLPSRTKGGLVVASQLGSTAICCDVASGQRSHGIRPGATGLQALNIKLQV